jgi:hypothetical protein
LSINVVTKTATAGSTCSGVGASVVVGIAIVVGVSTTMEVVDATLVEGSGSVVLGIVLVVVAAAVVVVATVVKGT